MRGRSVKHMLNATIAATDGDIGRCKDGLFEEDSWVLRYLVVDTHKWLPFGHKLVISPISVDLADSTDHTLAIRLTREQIKNSPPLSEHEPVSRKYEKLLYQYYGYGQYWMGLGLWGAYAQPDSLVEATPEDVLREEVEQEGHLRSIVELEHYRVKCGENVVGHVVDFIFDEQTWSITAAVIDTENWPHGHGQHLLPVNKIDGIEWIGRYLSTTLATEEISELEGFETAH